MVVLNWRWCDQCWKNHKLIRVRESCPPRPVYESCFVKEEDEVVDIPRDMVKICNDCGYGNENTTMLMTNPPMWKCKGCSEYHKFGYSG